ncbi:MAG: GT4 family glycosyltransferase PelF, partial [Candidatus Saccharimonas sp.]|nr:GT4 family glycosyltransferase PelF [Planctomycetaceae bacterium]
MATAELRTTAHETASTAKRPLRVCHVSLTLKTGGLERILTDIARHHDSSECVPEFLAIREVGRFADEIRRTGCPVHLLQPAGRLGLVRQMMRLFRTGHFDVVHTHNTYPHLYASLAARLAGVPIVVNTRHGQRAGHGWKSRTQFRWASHLVDRIIAVSDDAARLCIEADGVAARKVTRIWNGIDLSDFSFTGPAATPIAISVARLSAEKDFPTLLRAVARAIREVPDLQLKLVGDGAERPKLEGLTRELGITSCVEFLGERTDVPSLLAQAGFFVSSSLTEGISLTLLEAMAVGLPVVATAVGGNSEIVADGVTGQLVPPADPESLARAIVTMCRNETRWTALGQAGRDRVSEHFEVRRMVSEYEHLYRELLEQKQRPRSAR